MNSKEIEYLKLLSTIKDDNEIQSALKEGYKILNTVKYKGNEELYKKFSKEYEDLCRAIKLAIENNQKISKDERLKIMLELSDIVKLTEDNGIIEKKGLLSNIIGLSKADNTKKEVKEISKKLRDRKISDYTQEEAFTVLTYLNENYNLIKDEGIIGLNKDSISDLKDKKDINKFQEMLIEKILGKGHKGYDSRGYLMAFNKGLGNYLSNVQNVEKAIKSNDFQDMGNLVVRSYLNYLEANGKLTKEYLIKTFKEEKSKEILGFAERNKDKDKKIGFLNFDKIVNLLKDISDLVVEIKNKVFNFFKEIINSKNFDDFEKNLKGIDKLKDNEKEQLLMLLEKELANQNSKLRNMFSQPLLKKGKPQKEAEKIVDELIENIKLNLTPNKLGEVYKLIEGFNKKYKTNVDGQKAVNQATEAKTLGTVIEGMKGKQGIKEQKEKLKEIQLTKEINNYLTSEQAKKIGKGKLNYKIFLEKLRKSDINLDKELKWLEESQKELEQKYTKESKTKFADSQESQILKSENTFSFLDGTKMNYSQLSNGGYLVETKVGNIEVSSGEFDIIKNNKDALKNIIKFREALEELNLLGLFKYRESIFKAISNKYTINFNTKDDYLNKNELMIFIQAILQSIGHKVKNPTNIDSLKSEVMVINRVGLIGGTKDINVYGDSFIEQEFIQKFDPERTSILNQNIFEKSLNCTN